MSVPVVHYFRMGVYGFVDLRIAGAKLQFSSAQYVVRVKRVIHRGCTSLFMSYAGLVCGMWLPMEVLRVKSTVKRNVPVALCICLLLA